jgi:hypothetical protein
MKNSIKSICAAIAAVIATCSFAPLFFYFQNYGVAYFHEAVYVLVIYLSVGTVYFLICLLFMRSFVKSAFAACIFVLVFTNYRFIEAAFAYVFPMIRLWHCAPVLFVILLHINWFIGRRKQPDTVYFKTVFLTALVFSFLILFNFAMTLPQIFENITRDKARESAIAAYEGDRTLLRPNIYYFIFDEYSSFETIKKYYDYDNDGFAEFLEERGFTVSRDSFGSWTSTGIIIANLMALEYKWLEGGTAVYLEAWIDNPMFRLMDSLGYTIKGLGASPRSFGLSDEAVRLTSSTIEGVDFAKLLLRNSMIGFFVNEEDAYHERAREVLETRDYFRSFRPAEGNNFVFSYIVSPHVPYMFDRHGNMHRDLTMAENNVCPEPYLEQYIFITSLMREIADTIIAADPESIIIFQSDHSSRTLTDPVTGENLIDYADRRNILNAVYFKGEPLPQIKGQSKVNTMRIILSELTELDFPVLPAPEPCEGDKNEIG